MEDKLVTLAIHTYQKAQIIKTLLESEGIEVYLHNVNLISPVVSSGVRVRIKESDLPAALKYIEDTPFFHEDKVELADKEQSKKILIPVDFSDYSIQACEIGFNYAKEINAEVIIMHVFFAPSFSSSISLGDPFFMNDSFTYPTAPVSDMKEKEPDGILKKTKEELKKFANSIQEKIKSKEWPDIPFSTKLREGLPEEEILSYSKKHHLTLIIMGTRGKNQKDVDLIGSVTAEVIERIKVPIFAIPEKTPFRNFSKVKRIAFGTSFDQRDFIAFDTLFKMFQHYDIEFFLFHITHKQDTWNEIKLAGIKDYFAKQYPDIKVKYDILDAYDFALNLDKFIQDNEIDIISLSTYRRNLFTRVFNPSVARKMLFHTDTPLLAIRS